MWLRRIVSLTVVNLLGAIRIKKKEKQSSPGVSSFLSRPLWSFELAVGYNKQKTRSVDEIRTVNNHSEEPDDVHLGRDNIRIQLENLRESESKIKNRITLMKNEQKII